MFGASVPVRTITGNPAGQHLLSPATTVWKRLNLASVMNDVARGWCACGESESTAAMPLVTAALRQSKRSLRGFVRVSIGECIWRNLHDRGVLYTYWN